MKRANVPLTHTQLKSSYEMSMQIAYLKLIEFNVLDKIAKKKEEKKE